MRTRLLISLAIGVLSCLLTWQVMNHLELGAADFNWSLRAADDLWHGRDVYGHPFRDTVPYPLPAAFVALPLVGLSQAVAGGIFIGLSSALLAFGLTRHGYDRLFIFCAFPYWSAMLTVQWTPLLMAAAFFPLLLPVTMMKPNTGIPIALSNVTLRGIHCCALFLGISLGMMPSWPLRWFSQLGGYVAYAPLLLFPGQLLLLALLRKEDPDTSLLLMMALMPQRWFYDAFVLWLIPKTRREILCASAVSWIAGYWRWYHRPHGIEEVGLWAVLWFYLPTLLVILARGWRDGDSIAARTFAGAGAGQVRIAPSL
jgi:hypothetical protein